MSSHIHFLSIPALVLIATLSASSAHAADAAPVGGRFMCKTDEEHKNRVEGDPAHELILLRSKCDGRASGASARFDGGQVIMLELDDLVRGNGTLRGYDHIKYPDGSVQMDSYIGQQTTTVVNGKQEWTAVGTWEQTAGTRGLATSHLRGTWTAKSTSDTEYVIDWEGASAETGP
ncbi:conserved exported protein of unknown function [Bradyrhizobium sp. ORS 285]|uniref:hypothetical protein n=1 Tax=Bradyrhizobium sp. ORS 285 TaxID=115808 RepID=UPI0002408A6C|nr:hypothetical protein [Bradyrhizobium sp. ORS 285]CCD89185.1 conserved exported hypothetical protein [Bradyrhizobium sp. ORS 285]SMX59440.1 conserved exported protein of unknown function [Bradyrhizobium sp. ORS 285]